MKRIKRILILALCIFPFLDVYAAGSASISSNETVVNGDKVTATVTLKNMAAWDIRINGSGSTDGCSTHEVGDSGTGNNTTKSFSVTCKATSLGTITFSFSGDVTSSDGTNTKVSGSKKVTVVKPREKSTNNNLKSLGVEGYTITPEFNKDTLEYSLELDSSVEKINIVASLEDGYASVTGNGEKEVVEGANKFEITATSETGVSKTYVLNVNVKDSNPIEEKVDGKTFTLVKRASSLSLPDGVNKELFTESKVTIGENEIPAYVSEELKFSLIGLRDENGIVYLYKYEDGKITSRYEVITSKGLTILFEEPKEELKGYEKSTAKIGDKEYTVYKNDNLNDYVLIYGTNVETNESGWYAYNLKENSIQTFMQDVIDSINNDCDKKIDQYKVVIICLSGLSLLLLVITLLVIISKKRLKKRMKNKVEHFLEETKELKIVKPNKEKIEQLEEKEINKKTKNNKEEKENKKEIKKKDKTKTEEKEVKEESISTQIPNDKKQPVKEESNDTITQEDIDDISDDFLDERERKKRAKKLNRLR